MFHIRWKAGQSEILFFDSLKFNKLLHVDLRSLKQNPSIEGAGKAVLHRV